MWASWLGCGHYQLIITIYYNSAYFYTLNNRIKVNRPETAIITVFAWADNDVITVYSAPPLPPSQSGYDNLCCVLLIYCQKPNPFLFITGHGKIGSCGSGKERSMETKVAVILYLIPDYDDKLRPYNHYYWTHLRGLQHFNGYGRRFSNIPEFRRLEV